MLLLPLTNRWRFRRRRFARRFKTTFMSANSGGGFFPAPLWWACWRAWLLRPFAPCLRGEITSAMRFSPGHITSRLFGWLFPVGFGAVGAFLGVFLVRRFAPEASGSGIPHLEAVLHRYRELHWKRVMSVKFVGGALAIGGGLALGREGPTVQMGGTIGAAVSEWLNVSTRDRLVLIAAGAGAGLAAAFNAPLAGLMFVLEEVQKDFRQAVFGSAFLAAAVADIVARFASGQLPVFRIPSYPVPDLTALPAFALLGVAAGLLGVVYNRSLIGTLNLFAKVPPKFALLAAAVVGAVVGLVAWFSPGAVGGGHHWPKRSWRGIRRSRSFRSGF